MYAGRQHLAFQPMLLNLPASLPESIECVWDNTEDDEFAWRVHREYGDDALLKLRYLIGKFDVGSMNGGQQANGILSARKRQLHEGIEIMQQHGDEFEWRQTRKNSKSSGRLSGVRVRLKVHAKSQHAVTIEGMPAGVAIERQM